MFCPSLLLCSQGKFRKKIKSMSVLIQFSESKGFEKLICVRAEAEFSDVIGTKVF